MRLRDTAGQATVELVALVPMLIVVACAGYALLVTFQTRAIVDHAAQNGARALLQELDARSAARASLPERERERATIRVERRRVSIALTPALPLGLGRALTVHGASDAGAAP
jgi:Flp pilus assembly protein TadG